jgi:K+-sensing histidine kinase KdpD
MLTSDRHAQRRPANGARPEPPRGIADAHAATTPTLNLLAEAVAAFAAAADTAELCHALARRLARAASATQTTVWLANPADASVLALTAAWPESGALVTGATLPLADAPCATEAFGTGAALRAWLNGGPAILGLNGRNDSPVWVVPLGASARPLGVAYVVASRAIEHQSDVGRVLTILGAQAALAAGAIAAPLAARQEDAEFLAVVAHDLKNVATSLKGYTQLLRRHLPPETAPRAGRWTGIVEEQVGQLTSTLSALVDLGRLHAGRVALDPELTDLRAVIEACAAKVGAAEGVPPLRLQLPGAAVLGAWDRPRLERALTAALQSVQRAAPEAEGIAVTVQADREQAWLYIGTPSPDATWPAAGEWSSSAEATLYLLRGLVETHGGWAAYRRTADGQPLLQVSLPLRLPAREPDRS